MTPNREQIIRMARQAGLQLGYPFGWEHLECFAALVAAAEREAIAQMIEDAPKLAEFAVNDYGGCLMCGFTPKLAATAVRARGSL